MTQSTRVSHSTGSRPARPGAGLTFAAIALLLLAVGCTPVPHEPLRVVTPTSTSIPKPIQLPADDAPHRDLTEWWYYTGHLTGANGNAYGFELVIFQIERQNVPIVYAAHLAVTDHQRKQFFYDQRTWTQQQLPDHFDLGDGSWEIRGDNGSDALKGTLKDYALDLRVTPTKPPALHGTNGILSFGPVGDSYYYSSTRLSVQGSIVDHGSTIPVTGEAWKDRQWGNFVTTRGGGWDWFSLQLADGTDLMLFLLRGDLGEVSPAYGTLVAPDGTTEHLAASAAKVEALGSWVSPHSHATYPSGWSITLPEHQLVVTAEPVLADQELDARSSTGQIYWEGEVTVTGQINGGPTRGKGYVELTGYAQG